MEFNKVSKKYALNNSYFKNRNYGDPSSPYEVMLYHKQHNELPFSYNGNNWMYDCFCEYQKRAGVYHSQFFTPDATAHRIAALADNFFEKDPYILDACCGFGQLTKPLTNRGFIVHGFDSCHDIVEMYKYNTSCIGSHAHYMDFKTKYKNIVANPPYEIKYLTEFLNSLYEVLEDDGTAILLIPFGFIDKERPKAIVEAISKFNIKYREAMDEFFERTKTKAEIVVITK